MKKLLVILSFLLIHTASRAQYASLNIDYETSAALTAAYGAAYGTEKEIDDLWGDMLEHYTHASIATAGIFATKYMDRKALKKALFSSVESYYYRHIYNMVANRITPKILSVAYLCIQNPEGALYWGPYLLKVTTEVRQLCTIFACVATNGKLSFRDLPFLEITQQFKNLFDLEHLGGIDWPNFWNNISSFGSGLTKDDILNDFNDLYSAAVSVASAGGAVLDSMWVQGSAVGNVLKGSPREMLKKAKDVRNIYREYDSTGEIRNKVQAELNAQGDSTALARLFDVNNLNITQYIQDFINQLQGQYYRMRGVIYWDDSGSELLASWDPIDNSTDHGKDCIVNGWEGWFLVNTNNRNYVPDASVLEAAKASTANACGWSQERCDQLNAEQDWYHYYISQWLECYYIYRNGDPNNVVGWSFSYHTRVYRSWNHYEEVYEDWFDSQTMQLSSWKAAMQLKLDEIIERDMYDNGSAVEGYENVTTNDGQTVTLHREDDHAHHNYKLKYDSRSNYNVADAQRMQGVTAVSFILKCHDGAALANGEFNFKINRHMKDWDWYDKIPVIQEEAMATSITHSDDLSQYSNQIKDLELKITQLKSDIQSKQQEQSVLLEQMRSIPVGHPRYAELRGQYDDIQTEIDALKRDLSSAEVGLTAAQNAYNQMYAEYQADIDEVQHIPGVMQQVALAHGIEWDDEGHWEGLTFVRDGVIKAIGNVHIRFKAWYDHSGPSETWVDCWLFTLRIHRERPYFKWSLEGDYDSETTVDLLNFANNTPAEDIAAAVNQRQSELQAEYPSCTVEWKSETRPGQEVEDDDNDIHLLWAADRLAIAREVDGRLTKIFAELVLAEKFLHARKSLLDMLLTPFVDAYRQGMHGAVASESYRKWRHNAYMRREEE